MARLSAKLRSTSSPRGDHISFWCPGCHEAHGVTITGPYSWGYDGNVAAPSFSPSILVSGVDWLNDAEHAIVMAGGTVTPRPTICHSFVRSGRIEFLNDCTHDLRGQTVDLPEWPEWPDCRDWA